MIYVHPTMYLLRPCATGMPIIIVSLTYTLPLNKIQLRQHLISPFNVETIFSPIFVTWSPRQYFKVHSRREPSGTLHSLPNHTISKIPKRHERETFVALEEDYDIELQSCRLGRPFKTNPPANHFRTLLSLSHVRTNDSKIRTLQKHTFLPVQTSQNTPMGDPNDPRPPTMYQLRPRATGMPKTIVSLTYTLL